ncbi:OmpP1/FadL family transporter [Campylobacter sp. MG1]|uniref:OmpP1/FadL family transporter n=1 Tax=Campylobacter sp. MG1 TaxID=2976332 RepID=UPI00226CC02B|nr:outer membrane protein transport protein [Campylobacter sp. MG1]
MNKIILSFVVSGSLLASNYRLVHLSSDGVALSSSNLAKSFSADAAFINPANMAFLGDKPRLHTSINYYNISGSRYKNNLKTVNGKPYLNASDTHGKEFTFFLPTIAAVYPINDRHYVGLAGYSDFAAVYGWNGDYAKALIDTMDIRGGTLAISYAYKASSELSFGASLKVNYAKVKYSLIKDNAKNPRYVPVDGRKPILTVYDDNGVSQNIYPSFAYSGSGKADTKYTLGYSLSATYRPDYFDNKLSFSLLYNSSHNNRFRGNFDFKMSKFAMHDFMYSLIPSSLENINPSDNKKMGELLGMAIGYASVITETVNPITGKPQKSQDDTVHYSGPMATSMLYPANVNLGIAYEHGKHEFMFNIGRTFWKKSKELSIDINVPNMPGKLQELAYKLGEACKQQDLCKDGEQLNPIKVITEASKLAASLSPDERKQIQEYILANFIKQSFDQGYKDTTLISLGYRYNYSDELSFMLGFATEDSPVRRQKISFLAKDSRMYMYSAGVEYRFDKQLTLSLSGAYQHYADIEINNVDNLLLYSSGKFSRQSNQIINLGINYEF